MQSQNENLGGVRNSAVASQPCPSLALSLANAPSGLMTSSNSGYEDTAFGFRPNPRYARTSHIRKTLYDIPPLRRIRKYKNMGIIVNYGG